MSSDAYAGVRRRKQTPWRVKFGDALVSRLITIGGIATIAAVLLVVMVLLATAWPLHRWPTFSQWRALKVSLPAARHAGTDEFGLMVWTANEDGAIEVRSTVDGELLTDVPSPGTPERRVTCSSLSVDRQTLTLGFSDGSFQRVSLTFSSSLLIRTQLPTGVELDSDHKTVVHEQTIFELFGENSIRRLELTPPQWSAPEKISDDALIAVDYLPADTSNQFSTQSSSTLIALSDREVIAARIEARENLMTGEVTQAVTATRSPLEKRSKNPPLGLMLTSRATQIVVAWDTGTIDRYSLDADGPHARESVSGLPGGGVFTTAATLIGRQTLVLGDNQGRLHGWNIIQSNEKGAAADGYRLMATHELDLGDKPLTHIASSGASHLALTTSQDARLSLVMTTTDTLLRRVDLTDVAPGTQQVTSAFLSPKNDRVFVLSPDQIVTAELDIAYPEATMRALFGKVWYEGHSEPKYIWQSSAGTEQSEPKLSLIPLIFGTLKATLYAMVFSVPLALMAAIYTSEFLTQSMRSRIKPVIELMASLPSVILGFVAALVLAPLLQDYLCAVLLSMFIVPATFVYAAHLWNLLPLELLIRAQSWRLWFLAACVPIGLSIAFALAPLVERWLFANDIVQWMSGNIGTAAGGWMLLFVPAVVCLAVFVMLGPLAERNRRTAITSSPRAFALRGGVQLVLVTATVVGLSYLLSMAMTWLGLDLRTSLFAGYQERNSLLVGAVLGFCVIPLIYTLADDALQSVPQQLRSASLGCGATPWQTTMRVVVPSAMSGMFSAIMIGFGRAVGETMVVLMAAGNTPIMQWNPFNGFRTLSATLATELPEAAKGSTHFRTLFLAALLLFTLTLVANTVAEFVRIRFRRRGSQL